MARRKGLSKQQIISLFEDSDEEDDNLDKLYSKPELEEAKEDPTVPEVLVVNNTGDEAYLDLDFELDDDDDEDIRDSEYQKNVLLLQGLFSQESRF